MGLPQTGRTRPRLLNYAGTQRRASSNIDTMSWSRLRLALPVVVFALIIGGLGTAWYMWGPATARAEARAYVRCVERRLSQYKAMSPAQIQLVREHITFPPYTLRVKAEESCSGISFPDDGDKWDDMFWGQVRTTPSGELVPCSEADVRCPYEEEGRPNRMPHITKEMKVKAIMQCTRANVHCPYEDEPTFMRCRASFLDGVQEALVSFRPTRRELNQWAQRAKFECRRS